MKFLKWYFTEYRERKPGDRFEDPYSIRDVVHRKFPFWKTIKRAFENLGASSAYRGYLYREQVNVHKTEKCKFTCIKTCPHCEKPV